MKCARRDSKISRQTEHVYGECQYRTRKSWPWKRRVIYEAEVVRAEGKKPKDNPRFVVTNMKQSPQWLYEEVYCQRGDLENRIKELHYGIGDRAYQLHEFLGQSVPGVDDGRSLRVDAGAALRPGRYGFCPGTSFHVAGALPENRSSSGCLGASNHVALAAVVSLSR